MSHATKLRLIKIAIAVVATVTAISGIMLIIQSR